MAGCVQSSIFIAGEDRKINPQLVDNASTCDVMHFSYNSGTLDSMPAG